ncbi:hypothetical protein T10_1115 [Trichinella papuae]|uniref:Uncharacterized protein n=1 Tax=Trichinella papuae TaxID=268474 RepID=A0A0V1MXL4_9BILA|nr:hypothetical protein T10_1115 [Trichinella papuae]
MSCKVLSKSICIISIVSQGSLFWAQHHGTICSKQLIYLPMIFRLSLVLQHLLNIHLVEVAILQPAVHSNAAVQSTFCVYYDCYISPGLKHLGVVTAEEQIGYFCHFEASKC